MTRPLYGALCVTALTTAKSLSNVNYDYESAAYHGDLVRLLGVQYLALLSLQQSTVKPGFHYPS